MAMIRFGCTSVARNSGTSASERSAARGALFGTTVAAATSTVSASGRAREISLAIELPYSNEMRACVLCTTTRVVDVTPLERAVTR